MRTLAVGDIHGCFRSLDALATFAAFTPDGSRIITAHENMLRVLDRRTLQVLSAWEVSEGVAAFGVSRDGTQIGIGLRDGSVEVRKSSNGEVERRWQIDDLFLFW